MTPEDKAKREEALIWAREEALSWAKVGAADLAADIIAMIGDGADESEILARCRRATDETTILHSCKSSDIIP